MRVAVVGSGIAGVVAAHQLDGQVEEVVLFEADARIGGHTDTHSIFSRGRTQAVDSGFIVFNRHNYPGFAAWLDDLGVATHPTEMSFGVRNLETGLEYGTRSANAVFCQRGNLTSIRFLQMLRDLRRFYRRAAQYGTDDELTLAQLLRSEGYGEGFVTDHLVPMCGALWSLPAQEVDRISAAHVIAFMEQHRMLQLSGRPQWRVVTGGSAQYLHAFSGCFGGSIWTADPVTAVRRGSAGVEITSRSGVHRFDAVVMACHSDQALALLSDPSRQENEILGAIDYQQNRVVVHSDERVMPRRRAAWSSWNALVADRGAEVCQVTYWMNLLQGIPGDQNFFVTLNPHEPLRDVWSERRYAHPVFTTAALAAQRRWAEINGVRNTYYCGAYWGWGFHEDGFASATSAVDALVRRWADAA